MRRIGYLLCACHVCSIGAQQEKTSDQDQSQQSWKETVSEQAPSPARGNWYIKRQYDRSAREVYEYISQKGKEAEKLSEKFVQKQNEIHERIWKMYQRHGVDSPEVTKRIRTVIKQLEQEQDEQDLSEQEREWLNQAREHKASIEEVDQHITSLVKLHKAVDDAIALFDQQVDEIDAYEDTAWNTYEEIVQTPSDQVAQQKYHELKTIQDNVDNIISYGKDQFTQFLQKLSSQIDTYISRLQDVMKKLDEAGVHLNKQVDETQQREEKSQQEQEQKSDSQDQEQQQESGGDFATIWDAVVYPFTVIAGYVRYAVSVLMASIGLDGND